MDISNNFEIIRRNSIDTRHRNIRYFIIYFLIGVLSIIVTVLQIIFTISSNNIIYFVACIMFGPLHLTATVIALLMSNYIYYIPSTLFNLIVLKLIDIKSI